MQVLFLEVHIDLKLPEHSGELEAVQRVPGEAADGFDDDHVHLAALAQGDELIKLSALLGAGAGYTLIGVNALWTIPQCEKNRRVLLLSQSHAVIRP